MQPTDVECLDAETLAAYLDGLLGHEAVSRADHHIDHCPSCRGELSALATTHSFPTGSGGFVVIPGAPLEGKLGRYEILRELGRGSMGVVVRAYDPELDRAVALKILNGGDLLRREAKAMARLAHPNVVGIYDVIPYGDSLCIAMELVEGETLRDHVRTRRPWQGSLAACVLAGRGLAAAHAAGLIHRDFKPENVLCGHDGRVAVSDFGFARAVDERPDPAVAGTPAYMAPELFAGHAATVATDQFSFCVATYEALYGERPFAGSTLAELRAQIATGITRKPSRAIPAWIRAVLLRGLATDPKRRYASMADLLAALQRPTPRHRVVVAAIAALVVAGGVLAWLAR
ncbi:MAG: protein kinase [Kofleriaceae bacterium]